MQPKSTEPPIPFRLSTPNRPIPFRVVDLAPFPLVRVSSVELDRAAVRARGIDLVVIVEHERVRLDALPALPGGAS